MRFPRRAIYALLLAFIPLNLIVRYPQTPHGIGVDAFSFSVLSNQILQQGWAAWIVHPLSAFGLYPLSYPSGSFFLTAAFAALSGMPVEPSTLLLSLFVGAFGVLAAFLMAREFWKNDLFVMLVALLFPLMPKFVTNTLWEVPTRGLFMALTALFIWALLRAVKLPRSKNVLIAAVVFLLLALFHRLTVLMLVVLLAFIVMLIFVVATRILRQQFPDQLMSPGFVRRSRTVGLWLYAGLLAILLFASGVLDHYQSGVIFNFAGAGGSLANLAISLTRSVGILSPLAIAGIGAIVFARNKSAPEFLFLSAPFAIIPTLFLRSYTGFYVVAFFALFIGVGSTFAILRGSGKFRAFGILALIVVAGVGASAAISMELPRQSFMTQAEYSTGLYARYQVSGTIASNDGLLGSRVASISGAPYLPVGGATTPAYPPEAMAFGFVGSFQVVGVSIWDATIDSDSLYLPVGVTVLADWSVMMGKPLGSQTARLATRYNVTTILEDSSEIGVYHTGWGKTYGSGLLQGLYDFRYKTYESNSVRIWQL